MTRERAAAVVAAVAADLADPIAVAAIAGVPVDQPGDLPNQVWRPDSLGDGHPGIALLFAELATDDPAYRDAAHRHLSAATAALRVGRPRLFEAAASVAFAGHVAASSYGGYAAMLDSLDRHIVARVVRQAREDVATVRAGRPIGVDERYDVVNGATGLGRYLLARGHSSALAEVLESLVATALAPDVRVDDLRVPAWLSGDDEKARVNLGLAHGVAGPLALLAVSRLAGHRVDGQDEAIAAIVHLLLRWRVSDADGPYWPLWASLDDHRDRVPAERPRDAWCYGGAGIARALQLAGAALGRADWRADAREAVIAAVTAALSDEFDRDPSLCHGWAGLLQIVVRMAGTDGRLAALADSLAGRVLAGYDPDTPFGYRYAQVFAPRPVDRAGFLEGAAGVALALHAYATGQPPRTSWDAALLLT
jgi:lantibiotic modifying enzyme